MRQATNWRPSKFVTERGRLTGSRDKSQLALSSRMSADLIAAYYNEHAALHCRGDLVDLGCGQVPLYGLYRPFVTSVTCVDWPNSMHGNLHVDVVCDINQALPFLDKSFDTVVLSDVLEHLPSPEVIWTEIGRILRPGGKLLLNVPFFYWLHETPHDYYRYTEWALRRFVRTAGLDLIFLEAIGGSPEVVADILAKHVQHLPVLGGVLSAGVQSFATWLGKTSLGSRLSRSTARVYPYGYFLIAARQTTLLSPSQVGTQ
jgi:SAM-dependent methyltransferase